VPLFDVPSPQVPVEVTQPSESDEEDDQNVEKILTNVDFERMVEEPLAMIPPKPTMVEEPLEPECGKPMDVEPPTTKGAMITKERTEEAQPDSVVAKAMKLIKEGSTASQATADTPPVVGSTSGWTLESITWSFEAPLSRLSDD
jgi:hypothetical protein